MQKEKRILIQTSELDNEPNALANILEMNTCWGVRLYSWILIILTVSLIGTSVGFGVFADQNRQARTCPTVYDKENGVVTETMMQTWADDVKWTLTAPTWQTTAGGNAGCACDPDPDPTLQVAISKTPVWIAPCDLRALFPTITSWPDDFPQPPDDCNPNDHVKVCLSRADLENLWTGDQSTTNGEKHCHRWSGTDLQIFTGWDGDLYCKGNTTIG